MTPRLYIGCREWYGPLWKEKFSSPRVGSDNYFSHYASSFNFAELTIPRQNAGGKQATLIRRQLARLSPSFRISLRAPPDLFPFSNMDEDVASAALKTLTRNFQAQRQRILSLVIDVPPRLGLADGRDWLRTILSAAAAMEYQVTVQFHHPSWDQDMAYNMLAKHQSALVWSDAYPHPVVLSRNIYLRLTSAASWNNWQTVISDKYLEAETIVIVANSPSDASMISSSLTTHAREGSGMPARPIWVGKVIACIDLNAFYPSCEELRDPELRGKPHAVIMTDQTRGQITKGVVSSCSYEARKFGVKSAMPFAKALALCPDLILLPVDIPYYSTVSDRVMSVLEGFADTFEQASIDEAFIECTTKIGRSPPEQYGHAIKSAVSESCSLLCSVGIAPTKSAAKIACDFKKPDGLTVVYPDKIKEFLAPLEVGRVAGIGPKTEQALKEIGIAAVGQLADADVQMLTERFGKNGQWMWSVANGTDNEQVVPRGDNVSVSTEYTLDEFTDDRTRIGSYLLELVPEIYQRARKRGYTFRTVGIKLVRTDFTIETRETTFPKQQDLPDSIASSIGMLLDRFSFDNELRVRKIGIRLSHLSSDHQLAGGPAQKSLTDYT